MANVRLAVRAGPWQLVTHDDVAEPVSWLPLSAGGSYFELPKERAKPRSLAPGISWNIATLTVFAPEQSGRDGTEDPPEHEAGLISDQVKRIIQPQMPRACACDGGCGACAGEEPAHGHDYGQAGRDRSSDRTQTEVPRVVHDVLASPGQPIDPATRAFMEPRFGHDFSRVRVHTDRRAAESARAMSALAYTVGRNVVFGRGQYAPSNAVGRQLLAHELTHVVQQSQTVGNTRAGLVLGEADDGLERQADAVAAKVLSETPPEAGAQDAFRGRRSDAEGMFNTLSAARLASSVPIVQRACGPALGDPAPDCTVSDMGVAGWQFLFKVNCDELLPGEEAKISRLKGGKQLNIHGFASLEGPTAFNVALSCHRANRIAELARAARPDCPVAGTFKHGASPAPAPGMVLDVNPAAFWRSVIVEEIQPAPQPQPIFCAGVPTTTPATCQGRHDAYAAARRCFPLNSWLVCVDRASAEVCRAIDAFSFSSSEGRDLRKCVALDPDGDPDMTRAKAAWLDRTNACIWGHWRAALDALHNPSLPVPASLTPEWANAVAICRNDGVASSTCCDAQVVAEQTAIDHCGPYDSSLFGALPTDVPYSRTCSDLVLLATRLPFTGDFGDVGDRIEYGRLRCCTF